MPTLPCPGFGRAFAMAAAAVSTVLVPLLAAAITWLFVDLGVIRTNSGPASMRIALAGIGTGLATGASRPHLSSRCTGRQDAENVDD